MFSFPLLLGFIELSLAVPYSQYILAPSNRTLQPQSIYQVNGTATGADSLVGNGAGSATLGTGSTVTLDFGKNVAGLVSMNVESPGESIIGLTYTESSLWINAQACDATADAGLDAPYFINISGPGSYSVDRDHERGGFRYLSLVNNGTSSVEVSNVTVAYTAMPHFQDPATYTGYFHSSDEKLNRVWYAGAYTNQMCTIDPQHGDSLVSLGMTNSTQNSSLPMTHIWYLNTTIGNGSSVLTDGAKRDRLVWPGDIAISAPSTFVSTNDMTTVRNSIDSLLILQNATTGQLPYAGTPFVQVLQRLNGDAAFSFTYHLYSLIDLSYYYAFTGDAAYIRDHWTNFTAGMNFSLGTIDGSGLMNVTSPADWLRFGMGGHNIEANAILYFTLQQGIALARNVINDTATASSWADRASTLKAAANARLWNSSAGYYHDNETTLLAPQDGNAWAIKANLTDSPAKAASISRFLRSRWGPYGAPAPEAGPTVSPFASGFELEAHFLASDPQSALDLMRLMWADFMLDDPRMTNSTLIEGYSTDGALHYAPYANDARVSHAHGWASAPTGLLSFYVAGIRLESAMGRTWRVAPMVGDLERVEAGFLTPLGGFNVVLEASDGVARSLNFSTPDGTSGEVELIALGSGGGTVQVSGPGVSRSVPVPAGSGSWSMEGLQGGNWTVAFTPAVNGTATATGGQPVATAGASEMAASAWLRAPLVSSVLCAVILII